MALAVLKPKPQRTPERTRLAEALEELRAARARRATLETALQTAEASVWAASAAVEAAEADVEQSKLDAAEHLVAVASGRGGDLPRTTRQARDKLTDCQDALDAAKSARDELKRQHAAPANIDIWTSNVNTAIDAVLRAEASEQAQVVVAAATKARADLVRGILAVQFIAGRSVVEERSVSGLTNLSTWPLTDDYERERPAATARWRSAIEALANDADAAIDL